MYKEFTSLRIQYLEYVDSVLNSTIYGHESTKKQFKCIIAQWLSGGLSHGVVIGVQGPPGVGKTSLIKGSLAKCLVDFINYDLSDDKSSIELQEKSEYNSRPFSFISLGGSANGSTLIGHNITYHGSTHGDIVKCLKQAKVMNPVIFFDELDKISKTENGYEISSVLTHITDPVQNEHFTDRYFNEVPIDLSKAIIVFSYNDSSKIDRILLDRIKEINVQALTAKEKIPIAKNFLIPEICKNIGYSISDITLTDSQINSLVLEYTMEAGVRKLKEKIEEIVRNAHLNRIVNKSMESVILIEDEYIKTIMNEYPKVHLKKINTEPKIGCINGMYATSNGLGDIMSIQVKKTYSKDILSLQTTGSLEKVISESMNVAKTVAWNLLDRVKQNSLINSFVNTGLHIHCPDGSTSKDGPSAGAAITCAIYSLFVNKPIKHNISMTGEIDLDGNITAIGGLDAKLSGAKRAGVKIAYIPEENRRDIEILTKKNPELIDDEFKVEFLNHISQAISKIF
jgi:ATP-dependent Lon protease